MRKRLFLYNFVVGFFRIDLQRKLLVVELSRIDLLQMTGLRVNFFTEIVQFISLFF